MVNSPAGMTIISGQSLAHSLKESLVSVRNPLASWESYVIQE
jgi:hypothetical protein